MNNRRDEVERIIREGFADDSDHVVAMETVSDKQVIAVGDSIAKAFHAEHGEWLSQWTRGELARAALEAVSSIHEAEPVAWRADHEVDGEYTRKYTSSEWEAYQWNEAGLNVEGLALIDPFASDRKADLADMGAYIRQRDDAVADLELAEARLRNLQQKAQEQGVADGNMLNRIHPLHGDTRERPAPISKGVTVKALEWGVRRVIDGVNWAWDAKTAIDWYVVATASGEGCRGSHYWFVSGDTIKGWANSEAEAKALCEADFDARVKSCLSHTAGEIE